MGLKISNGNFEWNLWNQASPVLGNWVNPWWFGGPSLFLSVLIQCQHGLPLKKQPMSLTLSWYNFSFYLAINGRVLHWGQLLTNLPIHTAGVVKVKQWHWNSLFFLSLINFSLFIYNLFVCKDKTNVLGKNGWKTNYNHIT